MKEGTTEMPKRRWRRATGIAALATSAWILVWGLFLTPPDEHMGQNVRLLYVHPPVAWAALYLAFGLTTIASLAYLVPSTRSLAWDRLAGASAEVGVVFMALTLVTGSIWGRPTWGVWWTWDARLTLTALGLVMYLGYLALRKIGGEAHTRAMRNAIGAIIAAVDLPLIHFSVQWWNTLHQGATLAGPDLDRNVQGSMLVTLLVGFVAMTLVFVWLVSLRYDNAALEERFEASALDDAIAERRREAEPDQRAKPEGTELVGARR